MLGTGLAAWAQQSALPGSGAVYAGGTVSVDKDGRVVWNGKAVEGDGALKAQARSQATSGVPNIQLSADATTPYNKVGKVIEEAQRAGMKAIKFMPSGAVLNTPMPPPPGSTIPAPPPVDSQLAIIEKAKPDPQATPKPTAPPVTPSPIPEPIRVFVDFDNSLYLNGVFVDLATLETAVRENAALKLPAEVHIEPHRLATYARVEQVIATANKAGPTKFGVIGGT
jgi:biopolymer transport protein ExbD